MSRILIIDDDVDMCTLLSSYLNRNGFETDVAYSGTKGLQKFKSGHFDVILCDYRLGDKEGVEILKEVKKIDPKIKFIIITGYSDIKTAVRVIKEGAFDYISKPLIPDEVLSVIRNVQKSSVYHTDASHNEERRTNNKSDNHPVGEMDGDYLKGKTAPIQKVYKEVELVAATNYSVILYGESGTGKEVIAKTIHRESGRSNKPFVALDCGTLSKELAGSELFGHVKGAFTGAQGDKTGHFEMANGGTLFLDEVGNLSYDIQASLLRIIQERKLKRIGGVKEMDIDVRLIVASNENLKEAYHKGNFREDLFHRLNEFSITLPPLRERREDIPLFVRYFLKKVNEELDKNLDEIEEDAMEDLINYPWPGNIRELKNVIRRATLLASGNKITRDNLPWNSEDLFMNTHKVAQEEKPFRRREDEVNLKESAYQAEYETLMNVLKQVNYNKSQAAQILKIDRKTLYNKLKKFRQELFHDDES